MLRRKEKKQDQALGSSRVRSPDEVLDKLVRREEDGVDSTRPAHGDAEAAVHVPLEELDLGPGLDLLAPRVHERVLLVDALCGVDRVCKLLLVGRKDGSSKANGTRPLTDGGPRDDAA